MSSVALGFLRERRFLVAILALLFSAISLFAAIRPSDCARAAKYSESKRGMAMLVIQNGATVFEHYANGGSPDGRWPIFSGTKSFWGIAALCAVRDGLIKLDQPVADTISEWKNDPRKSQITIRQLLNFTDGIDGASMLHRSSIPNRDAMAIRLPLLAQPGTVFIYGPSHLQIFTELLRRKLNGQSAAGYVQRNVLSPLGLSGLDFKSDRRGNPLPASGFELAAHEWARLGELVLNRGSYHGRQIVSGALLQQAFAGSSANPAYGLTFWLNRQAPGAPEVDIEKELDLPWQRAHWNYVSIARAAPPDMIVGLGSDYQRLFIIPSMNAVIVRQGRNAKFSDGHFLALLLGR